MTEDLEREELYSHEFSDLWEERWLSRDQRREVGRAVWSSTPLGDGRLEALAVFQARRQWKMWVLQAAVGLLLVTSSVLRWGRDGHTFTTFDWVVLVAATMLLIVAAVGVVTHRRTIRRRGAAADWRALKQLAKERRQR